VGFSVGVIGFLGLFFFLQQPWSWTTCLLSQWMLHWW